MIAGSFTCPCCGITSHHPMDAEQGYCGLCHWWTGDPQLGPPHLEELCEARAERARLIDRIMDEELPRYAEALKRLGE